MRNISTILIALFVVTSGVAQEALWGGQAIISPEINEDKSVTFRLNAPLAEKVEVTGDFLPRKIIKVIPESMIFRERRYLLRTIKSVGIHHT